MMPSAGDVLQVLENLSHSVQKQGFIFNFDDPQACHVQLSQLLEDTIADNNRQKLNSLDHA